MYKKIIGMFLILALVIGLVPGMGVTAKAEEYKLYVAGVQVTSDAPSGEGWAYDAETNTLTLSNFTYAGEGVAKDQYEVYAGILYRARMNLNIVLEGNNTITMSDKPNDTSAGIYSTIGNVVIKGTGTLTVRGGNAGVDSYGVWTRQRSVIIEGGTINVAGGSATLSQYGESSALKGAGVTVNGGTVTAQGGEVGAQGTSIGINSAGELKITGGSTLATGKTYGMTNLMYSGGTLVATGPKGAVNTKATNTAAGTGWTDMEGTQGAAAIPASEDWVDISTYLRVQFPAGDAPAPQPDPDPEPEPQPDPQPDDAMEKIKAFVTRCYQVILGRGVDEEGLANWSAALKNGSAQASQIIDGIVSSQEYASKNLSHEASVKVLYQAMLGREPDAAGLSAWTKVLDDGYPFGSVINGFCGSTEFIAICNEYGIQPGSVNVGPVIPKPADDTPRGKIEAFVKRCYVILLERGVDPTGLKDWSDALENGVAQASQIIDGIVNSQEFQLRGLTNEQKVDCLYQAMLGRGADPDGRAAWVQALVDGYPYAAIINGFCGSTEFINICNDYGIQPGSVQVKGAFVKREAITPEGEESGAATVYKGYNSEYINEEKIRAFVEHCYESVLGRQGDAEGIEAYMRLILDGKKTPKKVAYEFVFSPEFQGRLPGNEEFIRILYKLYLNREPGAEELAGWVEMLEGGTGLEEIVSGFAESAEFKAIVREMKE